MALVLSGATIEVTNDGVSAVSKGPIYKKESDVQMTFELDKTETDPMSSTFAQQDVFYATVSKKATFSFTTVLGKLATTGATVTDTLSDGIADMFAISNLSIVEGTAVGGFKVFDLTPNSTGEGKGEITIKNVDRTVVIEKAVASVSISVARGGETELKFDVTGYVKSVTDGQTNTLVDPVKPLSTVLSTTDGVYTGVTVDGSIVDPQNVTFGMNLETELPPVMLSANQTVVVKGAKHLLKVGAYLSSAFAEGFDAIATGTTVAVDVNFEDSTDTMLWALNVPVAKVTTPPTRTDSAGAYTIEKEYLCRPTNGNDNFTLKYYSDIAAA